MLILVNIDCPQLCQVKFFLPMNNFCWETHNYSKLKEYDTDCSFYKWTFVSKPSPKHSGSKGDKRSIELKNYK